MPTGTHVGQMAVETGTTVAQTGVVAALTGALPESFLRFGYWLVSSKTTLTSEAEIKAFELLYEAFTESLSSPEFSVPVNVQGCLELFRHESPKEGVVYTFLKTDVFNIGSVRKHYNECEPVRGRVSSHSTVTANVLSHLSTLKCLKKSENQSIQKIIFGYLASMALEFSSLDDAVERTRLVEHLLKVIKFVRRKEELHRIIQDEEFNVLTLLEKEFQGYLKREYLNTHAQMVKNAVKHLKGNQYQVAQRLFQLYLILLEGHDKKDLNTTALDDISQGILYKGSSTIEHFHPRNPATEFLKSIARILPTIEHDYKRDFDIELLVNPTFEAIEQYVRFCLGRWKTQTDPLLFLLELKLNEKQQPVTMTDKDTDAIREISTIIYELGRWLRYHVFMADKAASIQVLLDRRGQEWLAVGEDAEAIQCLIFGHDQLLGEFLPKIEILETYLHIRIRHTKDDKSLHGLFSILAELQKQLTCVQLLGVSPLEKARENHLKISPAIDEEYQRFFGKIHPTLQGKLPVKSIMFRKAVVVASIFIPQSLESIRDILKQHAELEGFRFNLSYVPVSIRKANAEIGDLLPEITTGTNERREARAIWMQELFEILYTEQAEEDILRALYRKIDFLKKRLSYESAFVKKMGKTIEDLSQKIEMRLNELAQEAVKESSMPTETQTPEPAQAVPPELELEPAALSHSVDIPGTIETSPEEGSKMKEIKKAPLTFAEQLRALLTEERPTRAEQDAFIVFWRQLIFVEKLSEYRERLHKQRQVYAIHNYVERVEAGTKNPALKTWAESANTEIATIRASKFFSEKAVESANKEVLAFEQNKLKLGTYQLAIWSDTMQPKPGVVYVKPGDDNALMYKVITPAGVVKSTTIASKHMSPALLSAMQIGAGKRQEEAFTVALADILDITTARGDTLCDKSIWQPRCYAELLRVLQQPKGVAELSISDAATFLQGVTYHLLQVRLPDTDASLNALLEDAFTYFGKSQHQPDRLFWMEIIRGLFALGANPMTWLQKQSINSENEKSFYLLAEKIEFILSDLEFKAAYLEDSFAQLREKLEKLLKEAKSFASNLFSCVVMDDTGKVVRVALKLLPKRAEHERAMVLLATVRWIYLIFNQLELGKLLDKEGLDAFLRTTQAEYLNKVGTGTSYRNDGHFHWRFLETAMTEVGKALERLTTLRDLYHSKKEVIEATQEAIEAKQETTEAKQETTEAKQETIRVNQKLEKAINKSLSSKLTDSQFISLSQGPVGGFPLKIKTIVDEVVEGLDLDNEDQPQVKASLLRILTADPRSSDALKQLVNDYRPLRTSAAVPVPPYQGASGRLHRPVHEAANERSPLLDAVPVPGSV